MEKIGITVSEAGELLGLSRSIMYRLIRTEDFPAFHIGSRVVVNAPKLQEWADRHTDSASKKLTLD